MKLERHYVRVADVAKMLRQALRESFPATIFSVRSKSYSGGASIDVAYQDGPPRRIVEAVAGRYAGSYFDGGIDYKGNRYHLLDGKPVSFGADFIFVNRSLSVDAYRMALNAARAAGAYGVEGLEIEGYRDWRGKPAARIKGNSGCPDIASPERLIMHAEAALAAWFDLGQDPASIEPQPSVELARLQDAGDDGYGQGTAGPLIDLHTIEREREAAILN